MNLETGTSDSSTLCCCEYYDRHSQRYHILGCCCNCVALDEGFERYICCRRIPDNLKREMLLTFQDRLRLPCRGGAKQISLDAFVALVSIPLVLGLSALNIHCLIILSITTLISMGYFFNHVRKTNSRTKFFYVWIIASIVYLIILFEFTVPLLEILPEENAVLFILIALSIFCMYKVKGKSRENSPFQQGSEKEGSGEEVTAVLIEKEGESDDSDHPNSRQTNSCPVCQITTIRFDHHSYILDCCISQANHKYYLIGLIFGILALILGANLTLTSVCHPFLVFRIFGIHILLPDDCSEVFDQYEMGLSFVLSFYSCVIAILATIELIMQIYAISKGITLSDWKKGLKTNNRKSMCTNWKNFLC